MIAYFSATGNCEYIARRIAQALGESALSIETLEPVLRLKDGEFFGIITPTYFWELPPIVREWMNNLTVTGAGYSFVVASYGTTPGCCGEDARRIFRKRGITLSASFSIRMPDTWTPIFDVSDSIKIKKQNEEAEHIIDKVISRIKAHETGNHTERRIPYLIRIFPDLMLNIARRTRNFHVDDQCTGCGLCERKCPLHAIKIQEQKPVWVREQCTLCLRCLHHCPTFAIWYGNGNTKKHGQYHNPHVR